MREASRYVPITLMGLAALLGAIWLVISGAPPTMFNLALFLVLLVAAVTGLLTPLLAIFYHWLPPAGRTVSFRLVTRQALLVGLALGIAGWLQLNRLLDGILILGLIALVVLVELLLRSRAP